MSPTISKHLQLWQEKKTPFQQEENANRTRLKEEWPCAAIPTLITTSLCPFGKWIAHPCVLCSRFCSQYLSGLYLCPAVFYRNAVSSRLFSISHHTYADDESLNVSLQSNNPNSHRNVWRNQRLDCSKSVRVTGLRRFDWNDLDVSVVLPLWNEQSRRR